MEKEVIDLTNDLPPRGFVTATTALAVPGGSGAPGLVKVTPILIDLTDETEPLAKRRKPLISRKDTDSLRLVVYYYDSRFEPGIHVV